MAIIDIVPGLDNRNIHEVRTGTPRFGDNRGGSTGTVSVNVQDYVNNEARREDIDRRPGAAPRFDPFVRDVEQDELVENRLVGMLNSDSAYMRNARNTGRVTQAERGGLSSSMYAGAAQSAAIQAAAPIANADANAYRQAASENLQAMNANILAKLQSATQIEAANIGAMAATGAARINADAQLKIANLRHDHEAAMFQLSATHDTFMEGLRQEGRMQIENFLQDGRIKLTNLTHAQQDRMQEAGFNHDVVMSELSFEQRKQIEELFMSPRFNAQLELERTRIQNETLNGVYGSYSAFLAGLNQADIDQVAYGRAISTQNSLTRNLVETFSDLWGIDVNIGFGG